MRIIFILLASSFLYACTSPEEEYTEAKEVNGYEIVMVKESRSAANGVFHIPRNDGTWVAYLKPGSGAGNGFDHDECNWCLIECALDHDPLTRDYEECADDCNDDPSACDGRLPSINQLVVVDEISADNRKLLDAE